MSVTATTPAAGDADAWEKLGRDVASRHAAAAETAKDCLTARNEFIRAADRAGFAPRVIARWLGLAVTTVNDAITQRRGAA